MKGKQIIEEVDFLKSQGENRERILAAIPEIKRESLRALLRRHKRTDLISFLLPRPVTEPVTHEHGDVARYVAGCRCLPCRESNNDKAAMWRKERTISDKDPNDPRHGKASFYQNHGCRCEPCKAAHKKKVSEEYQQRKASALDPSDKRHGTKSFYTAYACRCERCKEAASAYRARRKGK